MSACVLAWECGMRSRSQEQTLYDSRYSRGWLSSSGLRGSIPYIMPKHWKRSPSTFRNDLMNLTTLKQSSDPVWLNTLILSRRYAGSDRTSSSHLSLLNTLMVVCLVQALNRADCCSQVNWQQDSSDTPTRTSSSEVVYDSRRRTVACSKWQSNLYRDA